MEINKIFTKISPSKIKNNNAVKKTVNVDKDKIDISAESKRLSEHKRFVEIVKKAPDIRKDVVERVSAKIKYSNYFDDINLEELAEKMINSDD